MTQLGLTELFYRRLEEETFVIPKPGCDKAIVEQCLDTLAREKIDVVSRHTMQLDRRGYEAIFGKISDPYTEYMTTEPLQAFRVRGENAIFRCRWLKRRLRAVNDSSGTSMYNLLHTSDSPAELANIVSFLKLAGFQFYADFCVDFAELATQTSPAASFHPHCIGLVCEREQAAEAVSWALERRLEDARTAFAIGIRAQEWGTIVYPHPYDYEQLRDGHVSRAKLRCDLMTNDAINLAVAGSELELPGDADAQVRESIHTLQRECPVMNAVLYSRPGQSIARERILERFAHLSALKLAAGSYGAPREHPIATSMDKFYDLAKTWKIY